jgi:hypothetical protein
MPDNRRAAIRAQHHLDPDSGCCAICGDYQAWPCDAAWLLARLELAERVLRAIADGSASEGRCWCPGVADAALRPTEAWEAGRR